MIIIIDTHLCMKVVSCHHHSSYIYLYI